MEVLLIRHIKTKTEHTEQGKMKIWLLSLTAASAYLNGPATSQMVQIPDNFVGDFLNSKDLEPSEDDFYSPFKNGQKHYADDGDEKIFDMLVNLVSKRNSHFEKRHDHYGSNSKFLPYGDDGTDTMYYKREHSLPTPVKSDNWYSPFWNFLTKPERPQHLKMMGHLKRKRSGNPKFSEIVIKSFPGYQNWKSGTPRYIRSEMKPIYMKMGSSKPEIPKFLKLDKRSSLYKWDNDTPDWKRSLKNKSSKVTAYCENQKSLFLYIMFCF